MHSSAVPKLSTTLSNPKNKPTSSSNHCQSFPPVLTGAPKVLCLLLKTRVVAGHAGLSLPLQLLSHTLRSPLVSSSTSLHNRSPLAHPTLTSAVAKVTATEPLLRSLLTTFQRVMDFSKNSSTHTPNIMEMKVPVQCP
jgi:hypothetical protein